MNWFSILLWGTVATALLTAIMAAARGFGLTRLSLPFLLGTLASDDRDRAEQLGLLLHLMVGLLFAVVYGAAFQSWGSASALRGAGVGFVHALTVLSAGMSVLPVLHPRMASERDGPTSLRLLEPPGLFAAGYGTLSALAVIVAHVAYGGVLGWFYTLA